MDNVSVTATLASTTPTLSVTPPSLTGLDYFVGQGPSVAESFVLSGKNLDNTAVTVLADGTKFEVSENKTTGFTNEITLATYTGSNKTIWVRAKAGQQVGQINDIVLVSGGGATEDKEVNVSGEIVSIAPTLSVSTDEINDLGYILGASTSISKLVSITGMNLDGSKDVLIGMEQGSLSNFEISLAEDGTYGPDLFVENYDGSALNVYVRLKTGMPIANNY